MHQTGSPKVLFVGLATVDMIQLVDNYPDPNQKMRSSKMLLSAGGPATNGAVAFSALGGRPMLVTNIGMHPLSALMREDLDKHGVDLLDLDRYNTAVPAVSSVLVCSNTGERSVVYNSPLENYSAKMIDYPNLLQDISMVLVDGHLPEVSRNIVQLAKGNSIPVVIDGGSWKTGTEELLPYVDVAICSSQFYPPRTSSHYDVITFLKEQGIDKIAITRNEKSILVSENDQIRPAGVKKIKPIDTLGAGDIFHGAFCLFYSYHDFWESLLLASQIATFSCTYFGTRDWIDGWLKEGEDR